MAQRYNNKTGEFDDVPSLTERFGKFCRGVLRVIFRTVCWLVAAALVGGGVAVVWKHREGIGEKFSAIVPCCGTGCGKVWGSCVVLLDRFDLTSVKSLGVWTHENMRTVFLGLAGVLVWKFRKFVWRIVKYPLGIVFYPIVKWWGFVVNTWLEGDRFMACVMLFPGLVLFGLYRLAFEGMRSAFGAVTDVSGVGDALGILLVVAGFILFVVFYARALTDVKCGELVVYRDWGEFVRAAVWTVLIPVGIAWALDGDADWLLRGAGVVCVVMGLASAWVMVAGAFAHNTGSKRWLSLFARVGVVLLLLLALGRLQEKLGKYRRGELGVIRGVLIPLIVFAWMFNCLVRPMIGTERRVR